MTQLKHTITIDKGDYKLIEQYWLLTDGKVARDTHTEPSRWLYESVLVTSELMNLEDCPDEVRRAFEAKLKRLRKTG